MNQYKLLCAFLSSLFSLHHMLLSYVLNEEGKVIVNTHIENHFYLSVLSKVLSWDASDKIY